MILKVLSVALVAVSGGFWPAGPAAAGPVQNGVPLAQDQRAQDQLAQDQGKLKSKASETAEKPAKSEEEKTEGEEPPDRWLAISGADVYTGSGHYLRDATVLVRNDKIDQVGQRVVIPEGATVVDARGMKVYPGLVAMRSSGLVGSGDPTDSTDVYSLNMALGLASGITTAVTGNTAAKLVYGSIEGMVLKENLFRSLSYSTSRPDARRKLREDLTKARDYLRDLAAWELANKGRATEAPAPEERRGRRGRRPRGDFSTAGEEEPPAKAKGPAKPEKTGINQSYLDLLEGKTVALFSASDMTDLLGMADLVGEFGFRAVVNGAREGWLVADRLGRAKISAIVTPRDKRPADKRLNRRSGSSIENARILWEHGVDIAIISPGSGISLGGIAGRDLMTLPMSAAFAVRGGLPEAAAIEAITLGAARLLGIDGRVGSIEPGKDADLIICDGELLDYRTLVQQTYVNGKRVYDKASDSLFAHIRPHDLPATILGAGKDQEETEAGDAEETGEATGAEQGKDAAEETTGGG